MSIEGMVLMADDHPQRCSLPGVRSISSATSSTADLTEDRRLPPLPRIEPLPRDPFNPFAQRIFAPSPPNTHDSFPIKAPRPPAEHSVAPPSPATSADSWLDPTPSRKTPEWSPKLSADELLKFIAPNPDHITRKRPLQQLCGRKRKGSMASVDMDDQREKHRIAEGNRRKNLSQLHRDLDERLHDCFLEQAGWNPSKSLPESKEHIVQGAIFLIDFMRLIIIELICRENELPDHLQEKMQPQIRCMQLQQLISGLQQQNQLAQQQINSLRQENQALEERNQSLEYQLSTEHMLRSPKSEQPSPQEVISLSNKKPKAILPGLRVFCGEIAGGSPDSSCLDAPSTATSQSFGHVFLSQTPPTTGPSSPVFPQASYSMTNLRTQSLIQSP
ncbi:putative HLH DNA binding domain protein [Aspergillus lucknowensis]|uniref:HLH DNA binding domain protein n=1 Tax=Aspergillus lucknowensis TaxID=176173 RepID=A0ABR4LTS9_9EURO